MIRTAILVIVLVVSMSGAAKAEQPLLIFAAASMTNAVQDIADAFEAAGNGRIITVFDATSRAARQMQQGAPAHVLVSANSQWAEWLIACGPGDAATRHQIAGNELVLIGATSDDGTIAPNTPVAFEAVLPLIRGSRVAIADPIGVPAGIYARQSLMAIGIWEQVEPQLVQGDTVRTVLNWVRTGTAETGIVYATDARVADDVRVLSSIPSALHGPIAYEVVATQDAPPVADRFIAFLLGQDGQTILNGYGFAPASDDTYTDEPAFQTECGS
ncbi:MAG: molybdate ABC transporter substrate-binding protein [Candidatus Phaeomarinobacter sp.]